MLGEVLLLLPAGHDHLPVHQLCTARRGAAAGAGAKRPPVVSAFDALVLSGDLRPWLEGWWELSPELANDAAEQAGL